MGPFVLTTAVADFILLIQYMLKYFDDFVGKNLGFSVFAELLFYFSLNMLQVGLPLGVLVASLMTFGNLGENFELTAIKGSGVSLLRTLRPIFVFVIFLSIGAFFFNNYTIPAANLKAYSLLYDIKQTKPALDIKEGSFYNGIPNFSIKAKEKLPDGKTLKDVIIYDHSAGRGNRTVILADSSLMYTIMDDRYLKLELFDGNYYNEQPKKMSKVDQLFRSKFKKMEMVFSLASFDLERRKEELFQNNRQMKNISELSHDIDSFKVVSDKYFDELRTNLERNYKYHLSATDVFEKVEEEQPESQPPTRVKASFIPVNVNIFQLLPKQKPKKTSHDLNTLYPQPVKVDTIPLGEYFVYRFGESVKDSVTSQDIDKSSPSEISKPSVKLMSKKKRKKTIIQHKTIVVSDVDMDTINLAHIDRSIGAVQSGMTVVRSSLSKARGIKTKLQSLSDRMEELRRQTNMYTIEKDKKYAQAMACILMFLVGAPLGAIIKKGGLGVPTIIAILFFIVYFVFTNVGEKQAKVGAMNPYLAVWMADLILLPFGLFFLRQARIDARLFDFDAYIIWFDNIRNKLVRNKKEI